MTTPTRSLIGERIGIQEFASRNSLPANTVSMLCRIAAKEPRLVEVAPEKIAGRYILDTVTCDWILSILKESP